MEKKRKGSFQTHFVKLASPWFQKEKKTHPRKKTLDHTPDEYIMSMLTFYPIKKKKKRKCQSS